MTAAARIGVLGGTFDPPHVGHLWLATLAADALGLDRVLLVPAAAPPHKQADPVTPVEHRVRMTELAIAGDPRLELSTIELERPGPSYTVETMARLLDRDAGPGYCLLMAADSFKQIETWREPDRLLRMVEWAVAPRPGSRPQSRAKIVERFGELASRIHLLPGPTLDVSSTTIRERVARGLAIRYLVSQAVEDFIRDHRLYR